MTLFVEQRYHCLTHKNRFVIYKTCTSRNNVAGGPLQNLTYRHGINPSGSDSARVFHGYFTVIFESELQMQNNFLV